ncbi:MAG: ATPase [Planctomycetota bacterium]|jgi:hypothetical protein|nr:ATPase [Planctomycetota bacterium]
MFVGRDHELTQLQRLLKRGRSSLVVCRGRRRIGKSTLVEEFGKGTPRFYEFQGLPPRPGMTNVAQLDHFAAAMADQFDLPRLKIESWADAFALLANQTRVGPTVVLLDEISWMARKDPDFAGQLKIAWDTKFKNNDRLILVLCGSVSSWIDRNVLRNAGFVGRVTLNIKLDELPLALCSAFWGKRAGRVSAREKFRLLSVTGGVPRYLEEIDPSESAANNIKAMCFDPAGLLFSEFDLIFEDTFSSRAVIYRRVVEALVAGPKGLKSICKNLGVAPSGVTSEYLSDLEQSGFIARDFVFSTKTGRKGKLSRYRLCDNYVRFYLKYVAPRTDAIEKGLFRFRDLDSLAGFDSMMGLQLENLVLRNLPDVLEKLGIPSASVISASPYFQNATRRKQACQIDLLVHTKSALFVCEVKSTKKVGLDVVSEVAEKIRRLSYPRHLSIRPVLIYLGDLVPHVEEECFFDRLLSLDSLL